MFHVTVLSNIVCLTTAPSCASKELVYSLCYCLCFLEVHIKNGNSATQGDLFKTLTLFTTFDCPFVHSKNSVQAIQAVFMSRREVPKRTMLLAKVEMTPEATKLDPIESHLHSELNGISRRHPPRYFQDLKMITASFLKKVSIWS